MTKQTKRKINQITPILALIAFLLIGTLTKQWNPTWLVFLAIPFISALLNSKRISISYTFIVSVAYIVFGLISGTWHPTWIIFLTIPVFYILFPNHNKITIWQSKEEKERQKNKKDNKSRFEEFKNQFFWDNTENKNSNFKEQTANKPDDGPEVEVIFDRNKDESK